MKLTSLLQLADNLKQAGKIDNLNIFHTHLKYCQKHTMLSSVVYHQLHDNVKVRQLKPVQEAHAWYQIFTRVQGVNCGVSMQM